VLLRACRSTAPDDEEHQGDDGEDDEDRVQHAAQVPPMVRTQTGPR